MRTKKHQEPEGPPINTGPIKWIGRDGRGIPRTWGATRDLCIEMTVAHLEGRPDRGPLDRWTFEKAPE